MTPQLYQPVHHGLPIHFVREGGGDAGDLARCLYGQGALIGHPGTHGLAYGLTAATHKVVGYVAAHRSGPAMPVIVRVSKGGR